MSAVDRFEAVVLIVVAVVTAALFVVCVVGAIRALFVCGLGACS